MQLQLGNTTHYIDGPQIMGIVNLTPDSFYAQSRHTEVDDVLATTAQMVREGVDILDIGAASSRPGAPLLSVEQEWIRLAPVLQPIRRQFPGLTLSIDSFHSSVVIKAFERIGPFIINDISAGEDDPEMFRTAVNLGLPLVAMHKRGTPQTMAGLTDYRDIVAEVQEYFQEVIRRAQTAGLRQLILDPGFGFAKTREQNYELLGRLSTLFTGAMTQSTQIPATAGPTESGPFPEIFSLIGISRKSMIYNALNILPEEALPASSALHLFALQQGVNILRVHDVAAARQMVRLWGCLN